jgi:ubiquinone/menaquinone biosynthesis C-methylase UbiE
MKDQDGPSLERVVESGILPIETLHPGGLEITRELAELCQVSQGHRVLDVASGNGETACFLAEQFHCQVVGVDGSDFMVDRAKQKARSRHLEIEFRQGDAHDLPFADGEFDAVISECTTCILDKQRAIREMARVARPGGHVGIHDLCWREDTPDSLKERLVELEGERPETLDGWKSLFEKAGLSDVVTQDRTALIPAWTKDVKKQLGLTGQVKVFWKILQKWGFTGIVQIKKSEHIFSSKHMGYGLIVGRKPCVATGPNSA